ncbi:GNAT family N-acetyltransferase [Lentimicrobium sp.]|uniref:GNAT family N-acetyltransferase n=1 Tax=Lentimicrobium sp. TaxID=2034841 RepID=UPI002C489BB7|nr:GNAT family N-acetyltransferase [Lentimicrobium sp.]HPR26620.1 GNAT family N-acetyltransferase [Lentimicrobium sp.]
MTDSEKIQLSFSVMEECETLQHICDNWIEKEEIEGYSFENDYIYKCLTSGDLPPIANATKEAYQLLSVYSIETNELVGFTDIYFGYPDELTAWISILIITKEHRNKGFAQEVISLLSTRCKKEGFKKLGIGVYLNNWRALRFWTKAGFNTITGIKGEKDFNADSFARIMLEKMI